MKLPTPVTVVAEPEFPIVLPNQLPPEPPWPIVTFAVAPADTPCAVCDRNSPPPPPEPPSAPPPPPPPTTRMAIELTLAGTVQLEFAVNLITQLFPDTVAVL